MNLRYLNMNILDPSNISDKDRALNFINYDAINIDYSEVDNFNSWVLEGVTNRIKRRLSELYITDDILTLTITRFSDIKDELKSNYDKLSLIHLNAVRIPYSKENLNDCIQISIDIDETDTCTVKYKFKNEIQER